mmetsp:Transcript_43593/g.118418  ORF Transcript_43593/g.118418 Transcript_43593/m.118418 type:complete len:285 (-) Transcript_43593:1523-2377(-)
MALSLSVALVCCCLAVRSCSNATATFVELSMFCRLVRCSLCSLFSTSFLARCTLCTASVRSPTISRSDAANPFYSGWVRRGGGIRVGSRRCVLEGVSYGVGHGGTWNLMNSTKSNSRSSWDWRSTPNRSNRFPNSANNATPPPRPLPLASERAQSALLAVEAEVGLSMRALAELASSALLVRRCFTGLLVGWLLSESAAVFLLLEFSPFSCELSAPLPSQSPSGAAEAAVAPLPSACAWEAAAAPLKPTDESIGPLGGAGDTDRDRRPLPPPPAAPPSALPLPM